MSFVFLQCPVLHQPIDCSTVCQHDYAGWILSLTRQICLHRINGGFGTFSIWGFSQHSMVLMQKFLVYSFVYKYSGVILHAYVLRILVLKKNNILFKYCMYSWLKTCLILLSIPSKFPNSLFCLFAACWAKTGGISAPTNWGMSAALAPPALHSTAAMPYG